MIFCRISKFCLETTSLSSLKVVIDFRVLCFSDLFAKNVVVHSGKGSCVCTIGMECKCFIYLWYFAL